MIRHATKEELHSLNAWFHCDGIQSVSRMIGWEKIRKETFEGAEIQLRLDKINKHIEKIGKLLEESE